MFMHNVLTAWANSEDMQDGDMDMEHGHESLAWCIEMKNGLAYWALFVAWMVCWEVWNPARANYVAALTIWILHTLYVTWLAYGENHPPLFAGMVSLIKLSSEQGFITHQYPKPVLHGPVTSLIGSHPSSSSSATNPPFINPWKE